MSRHLDRAVKVAYIFTYSGLQKLHCAKNKLAKWLQQMMTKAFIKLNKFCYAT